MFECLIAATALLCLAAIFVGGRYYRDTLHPLVYVGALLAVLYVGYPAYLLWEGELWVFLSENALPEIQGIYFLGVAAMLLGVWRGAGKRVKLVAARSNYEPEHRRRLRIAAVVLGLVGVAGFAYCVLSVGGIDAAFGVSYGGGFHDSGYVRETYLLTLPALLWLMVAYQSERPGWLVWVLIVVIACPFLMQGLLGARRGPTFLAVAGLSVGWYLMRQSRPRLLTVLGGGTLVGALLLLIVNNRSSIYLGSQTELEYRPLDYIGASIGNEYLYGGALILHAQGQGGNYWGGRYLQLFFVRPIPKEWWPSKYDDASQALGVPGVDGGNAGLATRDLMGTVGWVAGVGATPGIVADLWVEFWWLGLAGLFGIGWLYGRACRKGATQWGAWVSCFGILTALSIYLVMQSLEAFGFRALIMLTGSTVIWCIGKYGAYQTRSREGALTVALSGWSRPNVPPVRRAQF
jgi:oligosaccharide repeat unit polymerase